MQARLSIENVHAGYGRKEILRGISFSMVPGEIVAMIGPNGAGKSTMLKVIAGLVEPSAGTVILDGNDITNVPVYRRVAIGISYGIQGGRVFPGLSTAENLELGAFSLDRDHRDQSMTTVAQLFPVLKKLWRRRAGLLSGGERQVLAMAMVLVCGPRLLMLDEPSAGLAPGLVKDILERICRISDDWQTSVLIVEQNVQIALDVAHRALMLVNGRVLAHTSSPENWLDGEEIHRYYLSPT